MSTRELTEQQRNEIAKHYPLAFSVSRKMARAGQDTSYVHDIAVDATIRAVRAYNQNDKVPLSAFVATGAKMQSIQVFAAYQHRAQVMVTLDEEVHEKIVAGDINTNLVFTPDVHVSLRSTIAYLREKVTDKRVVERYITILIYRALGLTLSEVGKKLQLSHQRVATLQQNILSITRNREKET